MRSLPNEETDHCMKAIVNANTLNNLFTPELFPSVMLISDQYDASLVDSHSEIDYHPTRSTR